jgi:hypothetical protein
MLRQLYSAADINALRRSFEQQRSSWVSSGDPVERRPRAVAAAAFGLELAIFYVWPEDIDPLIEWGCEQLRGEDPPTASEAAWYRASVAAFSRARDDGLLVTKPGARDFVGQRIASDGRRPDHVAHASARLPGEVRVRLISAMLAAAGADTEPRRDAEWIPDGSLARDSPEALRRARAREAAALFDELTPLPEVGTEAALRAGYLRLTLHQPGAALADFAAAARSDDPFVAYLGRFLAGRAVQTLGNRTEAARLYHLALDVLPGTPSASIALAALRFTDGETDEAFEVLDAGMAPAGRTDDPWHLFGYGDLRKLPGLMADLRLAVRQ